MAEPERPTLWWACLRCARQGFCRMQDLVDCELREVIQTGCPGARRRFYLRGYCGPCRERR